jgi:sigma-B regulation protein RsbU (phosphoserine phosphatase)
VPEAKPNPAAESPLDARLLELTALFEVSRSLTSSLSLHAILDNLLRIPMGQMLIQRGIVLLKRKDDHEFVVEGLKGLSHTLLGKSLRLDPPPYAVFTRDIVGDNPWAEFFREFNIEILFPLVSAQGTIGIVGFGEKLGAIYNEREVEFLNSLSNIAAAAVNNGLMVNTLETVNRTLDRKVQQLSTIFDISRELNSTLNRQNIGSILSFAVMGELLVNKCIVFTKEKEEVEVLSAKGVEIGFRVGGDLANLHDPLILSDSPRFDMLRDIGISILVPMQIHEETKGILAVGPKITGATFTESDFEFLKTLGNQAISSLENARLFEETLEKQKMEEELNLARAIQQGLLPSEMPVHPRYDIAGINIPSQQVGGDYYDAIPLPGERYGIAIADVSGKGVGAALIMSNLQASLHALVSREKTIHGMVGRLNHLIRQNTALDKYITFFYGCLETEQNRMVYCNAGHNPPFQLTGSGEIRELTAGGIVLGMMDGIEYQTGTALIEPGDCILLYTDGITESMEGDEEYGEQRLKELLLANADKPSAELVDLICSEANSFGKDMPQHDDITVVVIRRTS